MMTILPAYALTYPQTFAISVGRSIGDFRFRKRQIGEPRPGGDGKGEGGEGGTTWPEYAIIGQPSKRIVLYKNSFCRRKHSRTHTKEKGEIGNRAYIH